MITSFAVFAIISLIADTSKIDKKTFWHLSSIALCFIVIRIQLVTKRKLNYKIFLNQNRLSETLNHKRTARSILGTSTLFQRRFPVVLNIGWWLFYFFEIFTWACIFYLEGWSCMISIITWVKWSFQKLFY